MADIFYRPVIFIVITVLVWGHGDEAPGPGPGVVRRCSPGGGEYGEHCTYVPAPPGRTPACAAPGYTYCEQLDYYPKDLIRHLVDKKQFDISSLLSDETRDDFGATRPTQGPYGYGPNSLRGVQHISLTGQQPPGLGGSQLPPQPPQAQDHGYYPQQENHHHQQGYPSHQNHPNYNRGNALPPPNGYVGYYTPSDQQRPFRPYSVGESYLPPKANSSLSAPAGWAPARFQPELNLNQYEDFWRGNSYFEVPKPPSFSDFHRNNVGPHVEYYDNNGGRPYYSQGRAPPAPYPPASAPGPGAGAGSPGRKGGPQRRSPPTPPPLTYRNPNDWWQRNTPDISRSDRSPLPVENNDLKSKTFSKRDISLTENTKKTNKSKAITNPFGLESSDTRKSRARRQAGAGAGAGAAEQLCPTRSQYITPRAALNKQGNWMYVVNMGENMDSMYSQLVKTETCVSQECNGLCSLPLGYTSRCEQRYVQKRLVALDQGGQRLYNDVFWFPSCCLCSITQTNPT